MPDQEQAAEAVEYDIVIDGEKVAEDWANDLTFREQRAFRDAVRELIGDPKADVDPENLPLVDVIPAMVFIYRRRADPKYELDAVLDAKPTDFMVKVEKPVPPTSARAKPKR